MSRSTLQDARLDGVEVRLRVARRVVRTPNADSIVKPASGAALDRVYHEGHRGDREVRHRGPGP